MYLLGPGNIGTIVIGIGRYLGSSKPQNRQQKPIIGILEIVMQQASTLYSVSPSDVLQLTLQAIRVNQTLCSCHVTLCSMCRCT